MKIYHIHACLKKRPGVYFSSGPLHPALKQDGHLFEVRVCSLKLFFVINLITNYLPRLNYCVTSMNVD